MAYNYSITLTNSETRLLAELVAKQEQDRRQQDRDHCPAVAYSETPYGIVPTHTWDAYRAATMH